MDDHRPSRPSRRRTAIAVAMALLCGALALTQARSAPGNQPRPNLLVIVTDHQTTESMRIMEQVRSRIGERGATFAWRPGSRTPDTGRYRSLAAELSSRLANLRRCAGASCSERAAPPSGP